MKDIASAITAARGAAKIAIDRSIKARSGETDPQLQIYSQMPKEGFDALVATYGAENVVNYIKTMEARRMKHAR